MAVKKQKLELTWIGKGEDPVLEPRILIEDPTKSYGDPKSENMLIHGDNLLALKALEQDFAGKIKCIYIDPPFNTGAAFDHYDDNIEHSIWLNLMTKRFKILRNLLNNEGAIFVNLDDSESSYAKVLLDEIFGRNNYMNEIIVGTNKAFGFKSTSDGLFKQANHILFYVKDKSKFVINNEALVIEKEYDRAYNLVFENTNKEEKYWTWKNINEVVANKLGYKSSTLARKTMGGDFDNEVSMFALNNSDIVFQTASVGGGAYLKRKETIEYSKNIKDRIVRHPNDDMDYKFIAGRRVIPYTDRLVEIDGYRVPGEIITDIWSDIPIEGLAREGGVDFPKGKKPEKLIQRCLEITTKSGDFILDSFLGSGTTAAVTHKMGRKWIGIELGDHIYTHCSPRLKSVVDGSDQSGISKSVNWKGGGGFKFYELAPSLLNKDEHGNWIISKEYNADMLAAAVAKNNGFKYSPDQNFYWKQGQSSEKDFIFTTTNFVTVEFLDKIHDEIQPGESLLICCKAFQEVCENRFSNITIKKIPLMLLGKCEFGKEDYSLNIINVPTEDNEDIEENDENKLNNENKETEVSQLNLLDK